MTWEGEMDPLLMIAVLALLLWTLLPQLDRYLENASPQHGISTVLSRLARWVNN
jgi:hypothetical protein